MKNKKQAKNAKVKSGRSSQVSVKEESSAKSRSSAKRTSIETQSWDSQDIIQLILADHNPLKRLIKKMKDLEVGHKEKYKAFHHFVPLLLAHAKSEEQVLYVRMKEDDETRILGFEGDVEHSLADQLVKEASSTDDEDLFCAKVKILAELVEHHIEEEESEILPELKENIKTEERRMMGREYLKLKTKFDLNGPDDARPQRNIGGQDQQPAMKLGKAT